jgi:hypothetical protein
MLANDGGAPPFLLSQKHAGAGVLARRIALRRQPHAMAGPKTASERPGETALGACEWGAEDAFRGTSPKREVTRYQRQHATTCTGNSRRTALTKRCGPPPEKREAARPPTVVPSGLARRCGGIRRQSDRQVSAGGSPSLHRPVSLLTRAQRRFAKNRRGAAARLIRHRASQHPAKSMPFGMSGWPLQILYDQITAADQSSTRPNPPAGGILASFDDLRATRCSFLGRATGPGRKVK